MQMVMKNQSSLVAAELRLNDQQQVSPARALRDRDTTGVDADSGRHLSCLLVRQCSSTTDRRPLHHRIPISSASFSPLNAEAFANESEQL
ncbi:hypothetical protein FGB62_68g164 [Gracilaria domingensis]|nr:hypothetical protein FGB62_68g164 [Gracilaria domingensis]